MSILMHVYHNEGKSSGFDISELVHNISYTTSILSQPGKLSFTIEKDPANILQISLGDMIRFWRLSDDEKTKTPIFQGYVFNIGTDRTEAYHITAYDQMRYLQNHTSFHLENLSLGELFKKVCAEGGIGNSLIVAPVDESIKIEAKVFTDASLFDILQYGIDWVNAYMPVEKDGFNSFGTFWYIRDNFGVLELREVKFCTTLGFKGGEVSLGENQLANDYYVIGDGSQLTDYQYEVGIDQETYNEFHYLYTPKNEKNSDGKTNEQAKEATLIGAIQAGTPISNTNTSLDGQTIGEDTIYKWGRLIKLVNVNDISDKNLLAEYMRLNVEHFNQPSRSVKLSALGIDGLYAGEAFVLLLNKLKINYAVYIISATHNYDGEQHTMDLEINTNAAMRVLC